MATAGLFANGRHGLSTAHGYLLIFMAVLSNPPGAPAAVNTGLITAAFAGQEITDALMGSSGPLLLDFFSDKQTISTNVYDNN